MEYYPNAIHEKAKQGGDVLFSFVCAVIAACVVGTFGEPFLAKHFGSGAPWWVYALLFTRFIGAVAHVITDDTSIQNAKRGHAVGESGLRELKDVEAVGWLGLMAPKGTPTDIVARLNREVVDILKSDSMARFIHDRRSEPAPTTGPQFDSFVASGIQKWGRIVKASGASRISDTMHHGPAD